PAGYGARRHHPAPLIVRNLARHKSLAPFGASADREYIVAPRNACAWRALEKPTWVVMRILLVHNFYQWAGGEDQVFAAEGELLERHGHTVSRYSVHNEQVARLGTVDLARKTLWNSSIHEEIRAACREHAPQIVHFHNTFPLVSPAGYYAARKEGAAVVQTLHNYRLICPGATLYRSGAICEQCVGRSF